jgi:hypothetical protein
MEREREGRGVPRVRVSQDRANDKQIFVYDYYPTESPSPSSRVSPHRWWCSSHPPHQAGIDGFRFFSPPVLDSLVYMFIRLCICNY